MAPTSPAAFKPCSLIFGRRRCPAALRTVHHLKFKSGTFRARAWRCWVRAVFAYARIYIKPRRCCISEMIDQSTRRRTKYVRRHCSAITGAFWERVLRVRFGRLAGTEPSQPRAPATLTECDFRKSVKVSYRFTTGTDWCQLVFHRFLLPTTLKNWVPAVLLLRSFKLRAFKSGHRLPMHPPGTPSRVELRIPMSELDFVTSARPSSIRRT